MTWNNTWDILLNMFNKASLVILRVTILSGGKKPVGQCVFISIKKNKCTHQNSNPQKGRIKRREGKTMNLKKNIYIYLYNTFYIV